MLIEISKQPAFGIVLTLMAYYIGLLIVKKTGNKLIHPLLTSFVLIIIILMLTGVDYKDYNNGGNYIVFLLGPATVALAIPLYRKMNLLKENFVLILSSTIFSSIMGILIVILLGLAVGTETVLLASLVPKAVTVPFAVGISEKLGGIPSLTIGAVFINGILGGIFGPALHRLLKVKTQMAKGLSMGINSHAVGTARAFEESELEGALSTIAFSLMGIFTTLAVPIIYSLFSGIL